MAWYRKVFTVPASSNGKRVTLLFDGAYSNADIYLNGQKLGNHPYGFTSFYYDLTPTLKVGAQNVVSVRLQVDQPCCRWYSGAGLYRHVWLITTNPIHIAQWGDYITSPHADAAGSDVNVNTTVQNETSAPADVSITTVIQDPSGTEVGRASATESVPTNGKVALDQKIHLATAQLWSLETPLLYHSVTEVRVGDQLVDATTTPFGIRSFIFTKDKGFFLNGQHVQIQGVCDHHDLGCLGSAAYRRGLERQIEILKSFGCNALRTSHNPPSPELLELCDKMGMLVMDEAFDEWKENQNKFGYGNFFDQWSDLDLASMIDRDRNHPCIAPWVAGEFVWSGFDYIGEPKPFGWPSRSSHFGIVDLAGFPKDRFYIYKSQWSTQPMVHIRPMSWNWAGFEGKHIPVDVFTNADSVELFLNGKSLGVKSLPADLAPQIEEHQNKDRTVSLLQSPSIHVSWDVAYAPGELKAIATKGGKTVAEDVVHTAGDPSKLVLTADRSSIQNNQDLSFIKVAIVDKDGFSCPNADNEITFSLKGNAATIVGLDNGDATNLESFKGTRHKAYHGLALAVLKSKFDSTGQVILTASADGLPPALITITVTPQSGSQ